MSYALSLQSLRKQIRHTIASDYYQDLDIKNCHPTILLAMCVRLGLDTPILKSYVDNRDKFFKANNLSPDVGKVAFLSIMNGGKSALYDLKNPSQQMKLFCKYEIVD